MRQLWFQTEAQVAAARAAQCLPDLIAPKDIANLALFLASDDSRLIAKQTISVNAGALDELIRSKIYQIKSDLHHAPGSGCF